MDNKAKKQKKPNFLPSIKRPRIEDKTSIDSQGVMEEQPTVIDILNDKIEPRPPRSQKL